MTAIDVVPATADRWGDLVELFGPLGIVGGCWCMYFRCTGADFVAGRGDGHESALRERVGRQPPPGLLAYVDQCAVGWCAVAPREEYGRILRSPIVGPRDDEPAWAITCLYVHPDHRGRAIAARLVVAAVDHAVAHGADDVEGYPVATTDRLADDTVYTGTPGLFAAAGFGHVETRGARSIWRTRP